MKLCLYLLLMLPFTLAAQTAAKSNFSVSLQPHHLQLSEQLIGGRKQTGLGIRLTSAWQGSATDKQQGLQLSLAYGSTGSSFGEGALSTCLNLALSHIYTKAVAEKIITGLRLGSLLKADYRLAYYPSWDDSHMYWANFAGAGLAASFNRPLKEGQAYYASLQLPLLGWVSRPRPYRDYKIENTSAANILKLNHQALEMTSLGGYFNPAAELGLQLKFSEKLTTAYFYQFSYLRLAASYSNIYREIQHGLGVKFIF